MDKITLKRDNDVPLRFVGEQIKSVTLKQERPLFGGQTKYTYTLYKTFSGRYILHINSAYYGSLHDDTAMFESSTTVAFTDPVDGCKELGCSDMTLKAFEMLELEVYEELE